MDSSWPNLLLNRIAICMNKCTAYTAAEILEILEILRTEEKNRKNPANKRKEEGEGLTYCWGDI